MLDIDRNINSQLYYVSNMSYINDISSEIKNNFIDIFTKNINAPGSWSVNIEPGEYYYRHLLQPVESNNCMFFIALFGESSEYPIYSYYAQSPLQGTSTFNTIPYHFIVDKPITIKIIVYNNSVDCNIKGFISIKKRVK